MLQLELCAGHCEGCLGLEEAAELLHPLPKGIALAPHINGLSLLHGCQCLASAAAYLLLKMPSHLLMKGCCLTDTANETFFPEVRSSNN